MSMTKQDTQQKQENLVNDIIKEFGNNAIVTRKDILSVYNKDEPRYSNFGFITRNPDAKIGHGKYVVTTNADVKATRDDILHKMQKESEEQQKRMLPKNTRNSVSKLAKEILKTEEDSKPKKKVDTKNALDVGDMNNLPEIYDNFATQDEIDEVFGGDINDILNSL